MTVSRAPNDGRLLLERPAPRALVLIAGCARPCTVGPDYVPPQPGTPDAWHQELTRGLAEGKADLQTWWTTLEDPVLGDLIKRARQGNLSLKEAAARVWEARARMGIAKGEWFPDPEAQGVYERLRLSKGTSRQAPPGQKRTDDSHSVGRRARRE